MFFYSRIANAYNYYKPDRPFLLIASDENGEFSYSWSETESDLKAIAKEHIEYGCEIICAIEVQSCRDIEIQM